MEKTLPFRCVGVLETTLCRHWRMWQSLYIDQMSATDIKLHQGNIHSLSRESEGRAGKEKPNQKQPWCKQTNMLFHRTTPSLHESPADWVPLPFTNHHDPSVTLHTRKLKLKFKYTSPTFHCYLQTVRSPNRLKFQHLTPIPKPNSRTRMVHKDTAQRYMQTNVHKWLDLLSFYYAIT